ncbi:putative acetyltransferase [Tritonibacter multivorans]|uniref:Putative acetyltransferase n=1 Tax=Tritonibacter multivorans TaxID=928856 RepID=A0A0P1GP79_9RHOB|nr:GNAT family N-acetyltransferase [Tritonibacter multivorans]MDA7422585.1 GNAT family N-acetyltransferase [Tritonibacter multivorans]CUH76421.1 putative acetyltransferase [Tritonibacter multivorans]SFD38302.1 Acetyltransferase (GNAT) family protein [Tritonibacter multivorans]
MSAPFVFDLLDATWPAAARIKSGPFTLREGLGGGSRVSAATLDAGRDAATDDALMQAEAGMDALGQKRIFQIRPAQEGFDVVLQARGYEARDETRLWSCPVDLLCDQQIPRVTTFCVWQPLAIQREIWAEGGIGPERLAVMERVRGPKTAILGRRDDKPAATAFVAIHAGRAMLHALEVRADHRRHGMGEWMMRQAAIWARDHGAVELCVLATAANAGANALYARLGMQQGDGYHYRVSD